MRIATDLSSAARAELVQFCADNLKPNVDPQVWADAAIEEADLDEGDAVFEIRASAARCGHVVDIHFDAETDFVWRDQIAGLSELRAARQALERWEEALHSTIVDGTSIGPEGDSTQLRRDVETLETTYPAAAAYLRYESWSYAANDRKAACGRKALEQIAAGEDHATVSAEADAAWAAAASDSVYLD